MCVCVCGSFIHSSPMLACWTLVGGDGYAAFRRAYPHLLVGIETPPAEPLRELLLPGVAYYFCWWVPYALWLLTVGLEQPAAGRHTCYEGFEPKMNKLLPALKRHRRTTALIFLVGHALACCAAVALALVSYLSYTFFTCVGTLLILSCIWQGALRYEYWMVEVYEKKLVKAFDEMRKDASAMP